MALSQTYCDFGAGNDYKGASFVDGAFTAADMTLTRTGAFASSKVNHWLYLTDNGSGNVIPGYYRIASVTSADAVVLATSPKSGATDPIDVKCTQHDGTITLPWRSIQGALDLITRDTTNGNQINVKSGTAQILAVALACTTLVLGGSLTHSAPLVIRGYAATANDGGFGEIDCGGVPLWAGTEEHKGLVDLDIHSFGNNNGIVMQRGHFISHCKVHKGASSPTDKTLIVMGPQTSVTDSYIYDIGAGTNAVGISTGANNTICLNNYVVTGNYGIQTQSSQSFCAMGNIIVCTAMGGIGIRIITPGAWASNHTIVGNVIINTTAGTAAGISCGNAYGVTYVANNICMGFSGAGGAGIEITTGRAQVLGNNAFYNNTANYETGTVSYIDRTANDVALAADPFTDAANGDFSLTAAAKAALADKGFPTQYLGAHVNTAPHITIGAIQQALATGGGFPKIASVLGRTRM